MFNYEDANTKLRQLHDDVLSLLKDKLGKTLIVIYDASCASGRRMTRTGTLVKIKEVPYFYREFNDGNLLTDMSYFEIMYEGRKNPQQIMFDQVYKIKMVAE